MRRSRQRPVSDLASDFETHGEEEDRHQTVVDVVLHSAQCGGYRPWPRRHPVAPRSDIAVVVDIRPYEGDHEGDDEHDPARHLGSSELGQGIGPRLGVPRRRRRPTPRRVLHETGFGVAGGTA